MSTQWPLVAARLVQLLPTLPGWSTVTVFDGAPTANTLPTDFASVGYVDNDQAGSYQSIQDPDGCQRQETGVVRCQVACSQGAAAGLAAVRARVFALVDALDVYIRSNRTLGGVLSPQGTSDLVVDVLSVQDENGTAMALVFSLHYFTVT